MLTKLSSAPAHPAPRAHWHPRSWQITAPRGQRKHAVARLGSLTPVRLIFQSWGRLWGGGSMPGDPCKGSFSTLLALFLPVNTSLRGELLPG